MTPQLATLIAWGALIISWIAAAFWADRAEKRPARREEWLYRGLTVAGALLLFQGGVESSSATHRIWALARPTAILYHLRDSIRQMVDAVGLRAWSQRLAFRALLARLICHNYTTGCGTPKYLFGHIYRYTPIRAQNRSYLLRSGSKLCRLVQFGPSRSVKDVFIHVP